MDPDLPCLETFVQLADCGSFSETAARQGISQPAVSQRIAKLEANTGLRLFQRVQEGLKITREGKELLEIARKIVAEHQRLGIRMGRHVREIRGIVRVMIDRSIAGNRIEAGLRERIPSPEHLDIVHPEGFLCWTSALEQHQVDIVVTGTFLQIGDSAALQRVELERQQGTTLAWNRVYFDLDPANFRFPEIMRSTILVPSERLIPGYMPFLERWCSESYGLLPPDMIPFDDESSAREACISGLGILVFPGEADKRMGIESAGLGILKTFDFLLPDAFTYAIHLRTGEKATQVLETALKINDAYKSPRPSQA
ncbi:LysR family transcriptional regulator [Luteolibacter sp. GHJ8]|uniref:LysR family transcriptional regulator n=1 Tax=Luteolibacter rhizosphaerae TaxID=2989719 RepID=A0ABT3G047_9BACT|nr:LysR family transcriptional regulator [Luteolibacter rhizosphaerae]MCW1913211.1 LysR family transcriptional regulator [Luteolibacter rhizosphaerae]